MHHHDCVERHAEDAAAANKLTNLIVGELPFPVGKRAAVGVTGLERALGIRLLEMPKRHDPIRWSPSSDTRRAGPPSGRGSTPDSPSRASGQRSRPQVVVEVDRGGGEIEMDVEDQFWLVGHGEKVS